MFLPLKQFNWATSRAAFPVDVMRLSVVIWFGATSCGGCEETDELGKNEETGALRDSVTWVCLNMIVRWVVADPWI